MSGSLAVLAQLRAARFRPVTVEGTFTPGEELRVTRLVDKRTPLPNKSRGNVGVEQSAAVAQDRIIVRTFPPPSRDDLIIEQAVPFEFRTPEAVLLDVTGDPESSRVAGTLFVLLGVAALVVIGSKN